MAEKENKEKDIKAQAQQPEAETKEAKDSDKKEKQAEGQAEEAGAKAEEKKEEDPLEKANKEIAELKDKYLRTLAEFDNYKKRTLKEKAELILNGGEKTVKAVLPVLDDFERALKDKSDDPKAIKDGVTMIFNKFVKTLESLGVKKIDTTDKDFDTDFHEAVAMVPGMGDDKKGKVIDCVQTGYTLNDKVIRHAKVAVGQ
ncbi:MAG: nucleotide exchange factor GrpE [Prevotella sp.]|uniref:nucleotide exchange factor GrpE n=1 Tax=Prevotella sp. TaxID=59823 RepID=UPI002A950F78|nr:nucleotide exchange factor GrpE [Prevotella sp.]MDD7190590.1 nucleotide exchange factor GrpE [Prevotella sp.]MDY5313901.1 nucleotide exchange factor GrpE [Prevotella sp.]